MDTVKDSCEERGYRQGAVLVVLMVGTFLAPLDSSIVNIAMPAIAVDLGVRLSTVGWVATAYLLTNAALLLSMGRLGDMWGLRRVYTLGMVIFGTGSALCAMSGSLPVLIASRVVQAGGASMLFASGPALVTRTFPPSRRGYALGMISLSVSAGLTLGPALGGLLVGTFGWPSIFLINIPLAAVVAVIAWRLLPDECPSGEPFDLAGAVLAGGALLALLLGLGEVDRRGLASPEVIVPLLSAVLLGWAFVSVERRIAHPMVDLRLFSIRPLSAGIAAATLSYLALFSVTFTMPFYLIRVLGLDERFAGLLLTATPLTMALFAPIAGRISDRRGSRGLATTGLVVMSAGLLALSFLTPGSTPAAVVSGLLVAGIGMAFFQAPNTASVLRATPRARAGVGSALIAQARSVGMAIGIGVTAAILGAALGGELPGGGGQLSDPVASAFTAGMSTALRVAALIALIGAALSWGRREQHEVEPRPGNP